MRFIKRILHQIPLYIIWLMVSFFLWSFIYVQVTDTGYDKKVVIFADCYDVDQTAMAARLEETMPEGLKMVKVRPFSYAMFDSDAIENADIYLVMEEGLITYGDFFTAPSWLDELIAEAGIAPEDILTDEAGQPIGIRVYNAETMTGRSDDLITYMPDFEETRRELERAEREGIETITEETTLTEPVDVFLLFGKNSRHLGEGEKAVDDAAYRIALDFLND